MKNYISLNPSTLSALVMRKERLPLGKARS
jgi:hypothetical protein